MNLEQLFQHGADFARKTFNETGEVSPMWIGQAKNGMIVPIVAPMLDKDRLAAGIKEIFGKLGVVRYVSLLESWTLPTKLMKGKDKDAAMAEAYRYGSISEHPDREEVIWIHAEDSDGAQIVGQYKISRKHEGAKAVLSDLERLPNTGTTEGRFADLFGVGRGTVQ